MAEIWELTDAEIKAEYFKGMDNLGECTLTHNEALRAIATKAQSKLTEEMAKKGLLSFSERNRGTSGQWAPHRTKGGMSDRTEPIPSS